MKFLKTEFAVQSITCWTFLTTWDQMKSAFVPYFFSLTGTQQIATEIVRKCNQVYKSMHMPLPIESFHLNTWKLEKSQILGNSLRLCATEFCSVQACCMVYSVVYASVLKDPTMLIWPEAIPTSLVPVPAWYWGLEGNTRLILVLYQFQNYVDTCLIPAKIPSWTQYQDQPGMFKSWY